MGRPTPERRRGACRSAWRFTPLSLSLSLCFSLSCVFARSVRSRRPGSIGRPSYRRTPPPVRRGTRKCIPGFLCLPALAPRRATTSGNNVAPPRCDPADPFSLPQLLPLPLSLPFVASVIPGGLPSRPTPIFFPLSHPVRSLFFSPLRTSLFLSSPSRFRHPCFAAPSACRKPPISTYLSYPILSCLSFSFPRHLSFALAWIPSPVRYIKPLGDIFSRRPWRKKKPNISWRQIVIGACTTGTVPLSADRSLVVEETVQRG